MTQPIGVLHLIDTLDAGGMERVAVNLVNHLPADRFAVHLGTTRREGRLMSQAAARVQRLQLHRRGRFDCAALRRLAAYNCAHGIRVMHAHGTAMFLAVVASWFRPRPKVIWHNHSGGFLVENRTVLPYRMARRWVSGVITVSQALAGCAVQQLGFPSERVWYVPNFVVRQPPAGGTLDLPGQPGSRIVCVANLRPAKDHPNLLQALRTVLRQVPHAHLLLVGSYDGDEYLAQVQREIAGSDLAGHVTWLGPRDDVSAVLRECDIAVLSSHYEGLPMALIEYGQAGLATVATRVGQCAEVLDNGRAGVVVPPRDPPALAAALVTLLESPAQRAALSARFRARVAERYSPEPVMQCIAHAYDVVLGQSPSRASGGGPA